MKDGRTRLAQRLEMGVDMETGAVAGVTVQTMDGGDTASPPVTLNDSERRLAEVGGGGEGGGRRQGLPLERDHESEGVVALDHGHLASGRIRFMLAFVHIANKLLLP